MDIGSEAWRRAADMVREAFGDTRLYLVKDDDEVQDPIIGLFRNFVRKQVAKQSLALEIGPSYNPILPKREGYNVTVLDHDDQDGLIRKYSSEPVDTANIEAVDLVWRDGPLCDLLAGRRFDAIVAAHVIEHAPDLIQFLNDCSNALSKAGRLFLLVPDRRYCFDYFQPGTDAAKVLGDHLARRTRHSFESFYRSSVTVSQEGIIAWSQHEAKDIRFLHGDPEQNFKMAKDASNSVDYIDAHENYFTPSSFFILIEELRYLRMTDLRVEMLTRARGCEFLVILLKTEGPALSLERFLKNKLALQSLALGEELERIEFAAGANGEGLFT
jgi:2-polyprenyl-3-methyl-5-hydroxy-6-metoxy-1,4-benzoquinol methylase